ncbi:hypothetical protein CDAR_2581 [Caerostris darwini]|uniref:Uncharacterized protein n=1 Tax=Caerostris darwini TaxID=1538125 RepID=A0AAV4N0B6_9ARAC|nr:hypothetical protein CDAR_2581 [Caerostris darwini]
MVPRTVPDAVLPWSSPRYTRQQPGAVHATRETCEATELGTPPDLCQLNYAYVQPFPTLFVIDTSKTEGMGQTPRLLPQESHSYSHRLPALG